MAKKRRRFDRRPPQLDYRKLFLIATEGKETEKLYFEMFSSQHATIRVKLLPSKHRTSPPQVLDRAKSYVENERLRKGDEIWLVIDRDQWTIDQLEAVFAGCQILGFHLAVSNPKFEYWLLLHFEDGGGVNSSRACSEKLRNHLPDYHKGHLEVYKIAPRIPDAIRRAEEKNRPPCNKWPHSNGSTVYLLVDKLYGEANCLPKG